MSDLRPGVEHHLTGIAVAVERMVGWAGEAGPDAPVPTCPGWTVTDLVVHQGAVHRWATAMLTGGDPRAVDIDTFEAGGREAPDLLAWLREGADALMATLRAAPDDLEAFTFLREAPPPRLFWARRQHHETTIHALDALAARDDRTLTAADAWFDAATALDGVDELLVGFWPRRGKGPRAEAGPYPAVVAADSGERWLLEVGTDAVATRRLAPGAPSPDGAVALTGTAVDLYLALWNRGGTPDDPAGLLPRWSGPGRIV
ncbi:maleylpyruvate isomerase family mycothiol-dependent enzyme [Phycicoccus avicenniae]|uniref:maleylpyruvate isomerase family mycothiol-dependent enzyme n=1 Tax=Phycicoccus avicenniae TaxID=2828860 RepID=UPI003D2B6720